MRQQKRTKIKIKNIETMRDKAKEELVVEREKEQKKKRRLFRSHMGKGQGAKKTGGIQEKKEGRERNGSGRWEGKRRKEGGKHTGRMDLRSSRSRGTPMIFL